MQLKYQRVIITDLMTVFIIARILNMISCNHDVIHYNFMLNYYDVNNCEMYVNRYLFTHSLHLHDFNESDLL